MPLVYVYIYQHSLGTDSCEHGLKQEFDSDLIFRGSWYQNSQQSVIELPRPEPVFLTLAYHKTIWLRS